MKKTVCFLLSLLMFAGTLTGCGNAAIDYTTTEHIIWPIDRIDEAEAPREYTVNFQGKSYTAPYIDTKQARFCSYLSRQYRGEDVWFNIREDTGELVFISVAESDNHNTEPLLEEVPDPEKTAIAIADQVVAEFAPPSDYERTVSAEDASIEKNGVTYPCTIYRILYMKYRCGLPTQDLFYVTVSSKGNFDAISIGETGAFDALPENSIDLEEISKSVDAKIQEIYSKNSRYSYIRHEIKDQSLCYTPDHKFAVVSNVSVSMRDNTGREISELVEITTLIH